MVHRHASARLDAGTDRRQRQGILRQDAEVLRDFAVGHQAVQQHRPTGD